MDNSPDNNLTPLKDLIGTRVLTAKIFRQMGYFEVRLGRSLNWSETHKWCVAHYGEKNYSWTGDTFWFDNKEFAIEFALHWG